MLFVEYCFRYPVIFCIKTIFNFYGDFQSEKIPILSFTIINIFAKEICSINALRLGRKPRHFFFFTLTSREGETTNSGRSKTLHVSVSLAREILDYYYCLYCFNIYVYQIWWSLVAANCGTKIIPLLQEIIIGNKSLLASNRYQLLQLFIYSCYRCSVVFPHIKTF